MVSLSFTFQLQLSLVDRGTDSPTLYTAKVSCAVSNFLAMFAKMLDVAVYRIYRSCKKKRKGAITETNRVAMFSH